MPYCILETEEGLTITEVPAYLTAAEVAAESGAAVIDPGPYDSYEEANDALVSLQDELGEDGTSDLPGTRAIESREEED
jgi:hypothetical protein